MNTHFVSTYYVLDIMIRISQNYFMFMSIHKHKEYGNSLRAEQSDLGWSVVRRNMSNELILFIYGTVYL